MLLFRKKMCFIVVVALIAAFFRIGPALSDEALKLADGLMEQGHYDEAITEYKRFIFFNPERLPMKGGSSSPPR